MAYLVLRALIVSFKALAARRTIDSRLGFSCTLLNRTNHFQCDVTVTLCFKVGKFEGWQKKSDDPGWPHRALIGHPSQARPTWIETRSRYRDSKRHHPLLGSRLSVSVSLQLIESNLVWQQTETYFFFCLPVKFLHHLAKGCLVDCVSHATFCARVVMQRAALRE